MSVAPIEFKTTRLAFVAWQDRHRAPLADMNGDGYLDMLNYGWDGNQRGAYLFMNTQDAEAPFRRFEKENIGSFLVTNGNGTNFIGFDLENFFYGSFQGILKGYDSLGCQTKGLDRFYIQGIGQV